MFGGHLVNQSSRVSTVLLVMLVCACSNPPTSGGPDGGDDGGNAADGGNRDAGVLDAGSLDAGKMDGGVLDAGSLDAGPADAGPTDAGEADAGCSSSAACDGGLCSLGACRSCVASADCHGDPAYGAGANCVDGGCVLGRCGTGADCPPYLACQPDGTCSDRCRVDEDCGGGLHCVSGSCVPGDCVSQLDCANGTLCGAQRLYTCGACSSDQECGVYTAGHFCDAGACGNGDGTNCPSGYVNCPFATFCVFNTTCCLGNCCSDSDCTGGNQCVNYVCSACDPPDAGASPGYLAFFVDPVNGDDTTATGSASSGGLPAPACAFKTLTRALAITSQHASGAEIRVLGPATLGPGETFPLVVTRGAHLIAEGDVTLAVTAGSLGLLLTDCNLSGFIIDGADGGADGIHVTGSVAGLSGTVVQNFGGDGLCTMDGISGGQAGVIVMDGGGVTDCGGDGLLVQLGFLNSVSNAAFIGNGGHGVEVSFQGSLNAANVVVANNTGAGVYVAASPSGTIELTGITATGNANGIVVHPDFVSTTVRNSTLVGNAGSGALVIGYPGDTEPGRIDLGKAGDPGHNVFQARDGGNLAAGVCLQAVVQTGVSIPAEGNVFAGPIDCSMPDAGSLSGSALPDACGSAVDVGSAGSRAAVDTFSCTN